MIPTHDHDTPLRRIVKLAFDAGYSAGFNNAYCGCAYEAEENFETEREVAFKEHVLNLIMAAQYAIDGR